MALPKDNSFSIVLDKFYQGFAPLAFKNALTEVGGGGHASSMTNVDVINGDYITQGPALSNLTNGTQAGVVDELIAFIMDKAVAASVTYGIGSSKLFKITPTTVTDDATWPQAITNCTEGESVQVLKGNLYYFFNKASAGEIGKFDLSTTFDHDWGSTVPTGGAALQKAAHPSEKKEDIILFGNGRYVGSYIAETNTLAPTKLDFGQDAEIADIAYSANYWYIAVNSGVTGDNRTEGQIYLYDGSATVSTLADEAGVGMQRIGFIYRLNGIIYIAFQDLTSDGYSIGYLFGSQIKILGRFKGTLPTFQQKTLYQSTILFLSSVSVFSAGALIEDFPYQVSQLADGGYSTVGAIASPFGTPMIASTESTNYKLAKFAGYDTTCDWKSITMSLIGKNIKGYIDNVTVLTTTLGENARCDLTLEIDQADDTSNVCQITGEGKRVHSFSSLGISNVEDFKVALDWSNGNATNACPVRKIFINGHYVEA